MPIMIENGCPGPGNHTLRAMFEDRKSIFVDLLKWDVPVLDGHFELDQFDTPASRVTNEPTTGLKIHATMIAQLLDGRMPGRVNGRWWYARSWCHGVASGCPAGLKIIMS